MQATVQQIQVIFDQCLAVHDKLETSLHDLSRTGDTKSCKAARKAADAQFKELAKELKPLLMSVQSSPQASQIWPKVCSRNLLSNYSGHLCYVLHITEENLPYLQFKS